MVADDSMSSLPAALPPDPLHWADAWLKEAIAGEVQRNPDSMTVASVSADGQPAARVVLCKQFVPEPGYVVFHTNYRSRKGQEFGANAKAAALFHWDALGRQVRIEGLVVPSPEDESDAYFATRGWGSRLGAWGSDQSEPIDSKDALIEQIRDRAETLGLALGNSTSELLDKRVPDIKRPAHWGGSRLWAHAVELWMEGADRIHDRARWTREIVRSSEHTFSVTPWSGTRLQP